MLSRILLILAVWTVGAIDMVYGQPAPITREALPAAPSTPAPLAIPCPPDSKSCKVVVITPEQEQLLVQMIENTGVQGPYAQIAQAVKFFTDMIAKAPQGTSAPPAKK